MSFQLFTFSLIDIRSYFQRLKLGFTILNDGLIGFCRINRENDDAANLHFSEVYVSMQQSWMENKQRVIKPVIGVEFITCIEPLFGENAYKLRATLT